MRTKSPSQLRLLDRYCDGTLAPNRIRIFYAAMFFTDTLYLGKQLFCYDFDKFLLSSL